MVPVNKQPIKKLLLNIVLPDEKSKDVLGAMFIGRAGTISLKLEDFDYRDHIKPPSKGFPFWAAYTESNSFKLNE